MTPNPKPYRADARTKLGLGLIALATLLAAALEGGALEGLFR
jgi:hypothetical protein